MSKDKEFVVGHYQVHYEEWQTKRNLLTVGTFPEYLKEKLGNAE